MHFSIVWALLLSHPDIGRLVWCYLSVTAITEMMGVTSVSINQTDESLSEICQWEFDFSPRVASEEWLDYVSQQTHPLLMDLVCLVWSGNICPYTEP